MPSALIEAIVIICSQRAHPTVPEQKIKAIIPFEIFMMLVMAYRGIDPSTHRGSIKSTGIKLPTQMAVYII